MRAAKGRGLERVHSQINPFSAQAVFLHDGVGADVVVPFTSGHGLWGFVWGAVRYLGFEVGEGSAL